MLQLMRFSVYLEGILNKNNYYFIYRNNDISGTHAGVYSRACSPPPKKKIEKNDAIWCVFFVYFDHILS